MSYHPFSPQIVIVLGASDLGCPSGPSFLFKKLGRFGLLTIFSVSVSIRPPRREEVGRDGTHLLPKVQEECGHAQGQGSHAEGQTLGNPGRMRGLQDSCPLGWPSLVV